MDSIQPVQQPVNQSKLPNNSFSDEYVHRAGAPDVTFDRLTIAELVTGCIRAALESDILDTERSPPPSRRIADGTFQAVQVGQSTRPVSGVSDHDTARSYDLEITHA